MKSEYTTVNGYAIRFSRFGPGGLASNGWWAYVPGFIPCFTEKKLGRWFAFNGPRGLKVNRRSRQVAAQAWFNVQIAFNNGHGAGVGIFRADEVTTPKQYREARSSQRSRAARAALSSQLPSLVRNVDYIDRFGDES